MNWLTKIFKDAYQALEWVVPPDFNHINVHFLVEAANSRSEPFSR